MRERGDGREQRGGRRYEKKKDERKKNIRLKKGEKTGVGKERGIGDGGKRKGEIRLCCVWYLSVVLRRWVPEASQRTVQLARCCAAVTHTDAGLN